MPTLVLVDDDGDIRIPLGAFLRAHGHTLICAQEGEGLFALMRENPVDLAILDVMLGRENGLDLCRQLRAVSSVPIIMLTAPGDCTDRVVALEIGADDCLTKPFDQRELLARVRTILRRTTAVAAPVPSESRPQLRFAGWRLDVVRRELCSARDISVLLPGSEFDLLLAFARHPQRILSRDQLINLAHGPAPTAVDRSIDVLVSRLRRKLEPEPRNPALIRTIRNGGYIFTPAVSRG